MREFKEGDGVMIKKGYERRGWSNQQMVDSLSMEYGKEYVVREIIDDNNFYLIGFDNEFTSSRFEYAKNKIVINILNDL